MRVDLVSFQGPGRGAGPSLIPEWRVGAIVDAVAVRDARSGQLWLDIFGQRHPARVASGSAAGPEDGERLQLRVLRNSPVLALETLGSTKPSRAHLETGVVAEALRRFVPRQESPASMLANLAWLAQARPASSALPRPIVQAAAQLWQALPNADALTDADALEGALRRSGFFLEADLADPRTGADALSRDLKALMLALSRALHAHGARPAAARGDAAVHAPLPNARGPLAPLPSAAATLASIDDAPQQLNELARQTEGALARLTTAQIANSTPESALQSMLIEVPVRHEDRASLLRLRIERDGANRGEGGSEAWTVEAAMDLGPVGALHAKVTLAGRRIGVQLRAESPGVVESLLERSGELEALLRNAGLEIDRVVCLHGMPAGDTGARPARLLDVRA